ncbi:unnamed protein product [Closterium sp. Yama58-4]|nr:unnamed protein product [Closterium sp. Yama58-4]
MNRCLPCARSQVYNTLHKGWAVRSWDFIPAGAVVCEYVGDVLPYERVDHVEDDMYVISIDTVRTAKLGTQGRDPMFEDLEHALEDLEQAKDKPSAKGHRAARKASKEGGEHEEVHYAIDGLRRGNRPELSHLLLVASENIPPLTELTYDYNYEVGSVMDEHGEVKQLNCCCGAVDCRGRLY